MPAEAFIFARPQRIWTRFIVFDLPGQYWFLRYICDLW
jgi:hypothetical protein